MKSTKFLLLLLLIFTPLTHSQDISCEYEDTTDFGDESKKTFSCRLQINNPNGFDEFERIPGKIDEQVNAIEKSTGVTSIIPSILCSQFKNLIILVLAEKEIEVIGENPLQNCRVLGALYLAKNKIRQIHVNALSGNLDLRFLDLADNQITSLPSGVFRELGKLEWLTLENNPIEVLQGEIFEGLKGLQYFYLSNCGIREVNPRWFSTMKNLYYLEMSRNQIEELPRGEKLKILNSKKTFFLTYFKNSKKFQERLSQSPPSVTS